MLSLIVFCVFENIDIEYISAFSNTTRILVLAFIFEYISVYINTQKYSNSYHVFEPRSSIRSSRKPSLVADLLFLSLFISDLLPG